MPIPLLVQLLCKSSTILDIDGTTNAGDEPALIEMRFHVKTLLTFASRSCAALKSRLSVPVMVGILALALAAAPLPAMADEEATQTVTIYPVSYTHLDVYKRQIMTWAVAALCLITSLHGLEGQTLSSVRRVMFSGCLLYTSLHT